MVKPNGVNWRNGQAVIRGFLEEALGSFPKALERRLHGALDRETDGLLGWSRWGCGCRQVGKTIPVGRRCWFVWKGGASISSAAYAASSTMALPPCAPCLTNASHMALISVVCSTRFATSGQLSPSVSRSTNRRRVPSNSPSGSSLRPSSMHPATWKPSAPVTAQGVTRPPLNLPGCLPPARLARRHRLFRGSGSLP
jgi:hypothetical protein